ncbi:MAG: glycosyltransferase [Hyphomicrobium aestuarii]|nr:glycosyltransferase [Hyphomicrobium aestuarii]
MTASVAKKPAIPARSSVRRIAIIAPHGSSFARHYETLIAALTARSHGVFCLAPHFEPADITAIDALGATRQHLAERPVGFQLFPLRARIAALSAQLASFAPHAVLASGGAELPLLLQAAKRARVARTVVLIDEVPAAIAAGQTSASTSSSMAARQSVPATGSPIIRPALRPASGSGSATSLKRALQLADAAVFHNGDHVKDLKARGLLPADLAYTVLPGSGVDLARFTATPLPAFGGGLSFLMIAPLDRAHGVLDFCEAARQVKARAPSAQFRLAGRPSHRPDTIGTAQLAHYLDAVEYLGTIEDPRPVVASSHVFVYPAQHPPLGEGMPPDVLEALAMGRPVITTNTPGCRDTVDERVNGWLVAPSDPAALAGAMETFLKRPDLIPHLARASRAKAERRFDAAAVNATLIQMLGVG